MIGEPKLWETNLQLLIDLLLTEGKPTRAPSSIMGVKQLPIIACNMDLVFMDRACMPRFGHGSFLLCLESLYKVQTLFLVDISRENTLNFEVSFLGANIYYNSCVSSFRKLRAVSWTTLH